MATEPSSDALVELVNACTSPSEAFWRVFELGVLRSRGFRQPLLEVGCGDGAFTALLGIAVDEAIDVNPRAVESARARSETYGSVDCVHVRVLSGRGRGSYATIFANSVFEHIPDIHTVLEACQRLLMDSGQLIFTVPLVNMNRHLFVRRNWYAEFRRRQLQHHNLWSMCDWRAALQTAAFDEIEIVPYLSGSQCRFWDRIDALADVGVGRYRAAPAARKIGAQILPAQVKDAIRDALVARLKTRLERAQDTNGEYCAAAFIATKRVVTPAE